MSNAFNKVGERQTNLSLELGQGQAGSQAIHKQEDISETVKQIKTHE